MVNSINIPPSKSATLQSPPTIIPTSNLLSDIDLLQCTRHINENVSILAGSLGISSANLKEIEQDYREVETQAYWVLKKWQETTSSNARKDDLHVMLQVLGFHKAAERYLCLLHVQYIIVFISLMNPKLPPPGESSTTK